jgi:hypothetical protein
MEGSAEPKPSPQAATLLLHSEFNEFHGQLSPDNRWIAYTSDESGQPEVYVRPFPVGEGKWRISLSGGEQPRWRGDGKEVFFVGADGKMMAVALRAAAARSADRSKSSFEPTVPQALFETHLAYGNRALFEYDVTADGKRFLLNTVAGGSSSGPLLNVVLNWQAGLKR